MLLNLSRLVYSAISSSRGGQAAQIEAGGISNITLNPQPVGSETIQIGNVGITQESGTAVATVEASAQSMLTKLESIRAVLEDGDGVNIAIQNMDIDMDNLETILNGATLAENGTPTHVTNDLIDEVKTAVESLNNSIVTPDALESSITTLRALLMSGSDGTNLRALKTDNTGQLEVKVTSQAPGVTATSIGKAEDAVHGSGDVGVMSLAVRKDVAATQAADGDYTPLLTDDEGKLHTVDSAVATIAAAVANSNGTTTKPGSGLLIAGSSGTHLEPLLTDTTGKLQVDIVAELPAGTQNIGNVDIASASFEASDGGTDPSKGIMAGGTDGTDLRYLKTDSDGHLQVDVLTGGGAGSSPITTEDFDTTTAVDNIAVVGLVTPSASGAVAIDGTNKLPVVDANGAETAANSK